MEKKQNVPALRFQGFSGEWKTIFLGDMVEILSGIMGDSLLIDGKYRLTRIETIAAGIVDESRIGYTNNCPGDAYLLQKGDILYSNINSIEHIGKVAQYQGGTELYHGINLLRLVLGKRVLSDFLFQLLRTDKYRKWARCHANQAVSQASINRTTLASQQISICNIQEQEKIGNLLRQLDNNITLTGKKIQKLQQLRQGMLTKLFPREGAAEPELRFRGFADKWEQCAAKKIFESKDDRNHPDLPVLTATQEYGMVRRDHINYNVGHDKRNEVGYKRVLPGQFVIHLRSFQGGFAHSPLEGITSPAYTVMAFRDGEKHDEYFWKYVFLSESFIKRLSTVTYGIRDGRSISFEDFGGLQLCFPSKEEQVKIGAVLKQIDSFISIQQKKLERMQRLKAELLEKMFV